MMSTDAMSGNQHRIKVERVAVLKSTQLITRNRAP